MKKTVGLLLISILFLAFILRFWNLGKVPISPDWDEVALGYNAYSLIQTGRDEYGKFLPVILRSFDDYKPALYTYLTIPPVYLFGLNVFAVRLPSAIFGVLAVLATFYLVRELFKRDNLALGTALFLAISPWHLQFSRVGFEANIGDALNIFAALFFIKGLKKPWFLTLSSLCAAFALHAYQSEKVFTPLFILLLVVIYFKDLIKVEKKKIITALLVGLVVISPLIYAVITDKNVLLRAKGTSIFQDQDWLLKDQIATLHHSVSQGDNLGLVFDNRRIFYVKTIIAGYLVHFNPNFLLIKNDIARHHAPDMGLLYLWELPFILIGIYSLLFHKFDKKTKLFIFGWFLLVPVPASITTELPHPVRTLNFLPIWQIFTMIGLVEVYGYWKKIKTDVYKIILLIIFLVVVVFNFFYYLNQYFIQQNYYYAYDWQYGYESAIKSMQEDKKNYKKVIVSDIAPMDKSYMFFLFYLKYPPAMYQLVGVNSSGNFREHHAFDKYEFRPINWDKEEKKSDILYIGRPKDFPEGINTRKVILYPDGKPAMKIVDGGTL